jgi:S-adenosylmethionine synthetase
LDLIVHVLSGPPPGAAPVEVVERKGLGHPDSICDALADAISASLCRHYAERFGTILHHNVDKILLCAGSAAPAFGGGEITAPIEVYLGGRATLEHDGERIPVSDIAVDTCQRWITSHLRIPDVERNVKIIPRFRPGSGELTHLFAGVRRVALANDTSCGAGFAPLTDLERVVLAVEHALNSGEAKRSHPAIGEDVKVMGVRRESRIDLTIGCAMIGRFLSSMSDYVGIRDAARELALDAARRVTGHEVHAVVNAADDLKRGQVFLTVTGSSAEAGDDGEVGRGNRTSGIITPYRPMTLEAVAGKNPVNHVGKLYNLAAVRIARSVVEHVTGVADASCILVSQIGRPIDDPDVAHVRLVIDPSRRIEELEGIVRDLVRAELGNIQELGGVLGS